MASLPPSLPILDLSHADDPEKRPALLSQLHDALFNVGFLYIKNHGVPEPTISNLTSKLPALFDLPNEVKASLSKLNSPHFLGYSGFAEETTLGQKDLREQFDFATELPVVYQEPGSNSVEKKDDDSRDFTQLYWRLRGPNQWPPEDLIPGFRQAFTEYHDSLQALSYRFVHLVEEAFGIPIGTFDHFFQTRKPSTSSVSTPSPSSSSPTSSTSPPSPSQPTYLPPQHRIKLLKYPPTTTPSSQGVGPHKDSSGWLTFLLQADGEAGLDVLSPSNTWLPAPPLPGTLVVNFGNAFEAATEGAVRATVHRVTGPGPRSPPRYSVPFFQGLPLDLTLSRVRAFIPEPVRRLRREDRGSNVASFLDQRWDSLGESQLRKWVRSHEDVARKWYGDEVVGYYLQ